MPGNYFIEEFLTLYENSDRYDGKVSSHIPIFNSYLDPDDQCITFQSTSESSGALQEGHFVFNATRLQQIKKGKMRIFMHYPGQLIKGSGQLRYYSYILDGLHDMVKSIKVFNRVTIQINHIK